MSTQIQPNSGNANQVRNRNEAILSARCIMPVTPPSTASATHQYTAKGPLPVLVPSYEQTPATAQPVRHLFHECGRQFVAVGQEISSSFSLYFGALITNTSQPKPTSAVADQMTSSTILFSRRNARLPNLIVKVSRMVLEPCPINRLTNDHNQPQEFD